MIDLLTRSKSRQRQRQLETENASLREEIEFLRSRMYSNGETKADKLNQLMNLENQSLKSGLTDIQSSLAQCVNFAKENLNDVNAASESFESLALRVESVLSDMASITAQVETSDSTVKSMLEDTEAITEALSLIKTIANQTNLISLNAAVEAARAGESGLGFAVVSNEVKNLSEKTQLALQEIDRVISSIVSNVKDIAQSNAEICDLTLCIQGNINEFGDTTQDLGETLNTRSDSVSRIADEVFLSLAKLDHMIWMVNSYLSVNIGEPAIPFVDHHSCRLGQWYEQGEGKDFFSHSQAYRELVKPHAKVHQQTGKIFDAINRNPEAYSELFSMFKELSQYSFEVIKLLGEMGEEAGSQAKTKKR